MQPIHIIGGGLAGCEATWQIARRGVRVRLHEMRPLRMTGAHRTAGLAELVCSNSFRSDDHETNAVGLLHAELRRLDSLILRAGDAHQVPAGGALAVDREGFSAAVTAALQDHPLVDIRREEITHIPAEWDSVIVATGPLTSPALAATVCALTGEDALAFFDAIAPIVYRDTIDMSVAWFQSRYDKSGPGGAGADYINCPLTRDEYEAFIDALLGADKTSFHEWEGTPYFDGCLPIEVMAERGRPMPWCSCARTTGSARSTTWSAFRPSSSTASRCASSAPSPVSRAPSSRALAAFTATPSSTRPSCSTQACG